jgi:hypothetical protein
MFRSCRYRTNEKFVAGDTGVAAHPQHNGAGVCTTASQQKRMYAAKSVVAKRIGDVEKVLFQESPSHVYN